MKKSLFVVIGICCSLSILASTNKNLDIIENAKEKFAKTSFTATINKNRMPVDFVTYKQLYDENSDFLYIGYISAINGEVADPEGCFFYDTKTKECIKRNNMDSPSLRILRGFYIPVDSSITASDVDYENEKCWLFKVSFPPEGNNNFTEYSIVIGKQTNFFYELKVYDSSGKSGMYPSFKLSNVNLTPSLSPQDFTVPEGYNETEVNSNEAFAKKLRSMESTSQNRGSSLNANKLFIISIAAITGLLIVLLAIKLMRKK